MAREPNTTKISTLRVRIRPGAAKARAVLSDRKKAGVPKIMMEPSAYTFPSVLMLQAGWGKRNCQNNKKRNKIYSKFKTDLNFSSY